LFSLLDSEWSNDCCGLTVYFNFIIPEDTFLSIKNDLILNSGGGFGWKIGNSLNFVGQVKND